MRSAFAIAALLIVPLPALAQPAVMIVRHAERADAGMAAGPGADPDLSAIGRARAEALAALLKDAGVTAIYVTEFRRTQQTAAPLAKRLGITPTVIASKDAARLIESLKASTGHVLVVGHSNTVPPLVKALGVDDTVAIGESEFDNLLVVTRGATPTLLRLRQPAAVAPPG